MTDRILGVMTVVRRVEALDEKARNLLLFMLVGRLSVENMDGLLDDVEVAEKMEGPEWIA